MRKPGLEYETPLKKVFYMVYIFISSDFSAFRNIEYIANEGMKNGKGVVLNLHPSKPSWLGFSETSAD